MSLEGNPHVAAAEREVQESYLGESAASEASAGMRATALATLAVAHELRTANLIALLAARVSHGDNRGLAELDTLIEMRLQLPPRSVL